MKKILYIIICVALTAGIASCGNSNSSKKEKGKVTDKELKSIEKMAKSVKETVEIKGNEVIMTSKVLGNTDTKIYTFEGDKCIGMRQITEYADGKMAQEHYDGLKEVERFTNVKLEGKKLSYDLKPIAYEWLTEGKNKQQLRDYLQAEIDENN